MVSSGVQLAVGTAVVVVALALTGCAPAAPHAVPPAPASASAPSTSTPLTGKPTLSQLVVTPNGLGYLVPGAAVPAEPAASAILKYDPSKCVNTQSGVAAGSPGAGAWVPTYPDGVTWAGSGLPFDVGPSGAPTDAISEIEVWSPELKTAKGIGAGSTVAQLTAAYGSALSLDSAENSDVYVLSGTHSELLFEVAKAASGLPVEEMDTVVWMRIVPIGTTQLHIANTDGSGTCTA